MRQFWRVHFLGVELAIPVLVTIPAALWLARFHGTAAVEPFLTGQRAALYAALSGVDGALLGFVLATTAIILGYSENVKLTIVRKSPHYPTLWKTLISTIQFLGLATVASLAALVIDRDSAPNWPVMLACMACNVIAALRVGRAIWILKNVIEIVIGI